MMLVALPLFSQAGWLSGGWRRWGGSQSRAREHSLWCLSRCQRDTVGPIQQADTPFDMCGGEGRERMKPSDSPGRPRSVTTRTRCIGIRIAPRHKLRHWASQSRQCLTSNVFIYLFRLRLVRGCTRCQPLRLHHQGAAADVAGAVLVSWRRWKHGTRGGRRCRPTSPCLSKHSQTCSPMTRMLSAWAQHSPFSLCLDQCSLLRNGMLRRHGRLMQSAKVACIYGTQVGLVAQAKVCCRMRVRLCRLSSTRIRRTAARREATTVMQGRRCCSCLTSHGWLGSSSRLPSRRAYRSNWLSRRLPAMTACSLLLLRQLRRHGACCTELH